MTMERGAQGAPNILSAEDILAKMRAGTKEVYEIRMREQVFPVRVLSMDEVTAVRRDAIARTAKIGGDETDRNVFIQQTTLKLATTLTKNTGPLIGDKVLSLMSLDETRFLYDEYIRVMDAVNPTLEMIDPMEFRALVDALKKNSMSAKDCSLLQLRVICSAFVELILRVEKAEQPPGS